MTLRLGDVAPDFTCETTAGVINFHRWLAGQWCVFFSHPKDFTPVCTTELAEMARLKPEFDKRNCKIIGLGVDSIGQHLEWSKDIEEVGGVAPNYPVISDTSLEVSKLYGMLPQLAGGPAGLRTAADNATVRTVFIVGPDKTIRLMMAYPMTCGRNFAEILRALDSLRLGETHAIGTPANWQEGDEVIIAPSVSDEAARALYPGGWRAPKPYLRYVSKPAA